jgi:cell division transport system permease protein
MITSIRKMQNGLARDRVLGTAKGKRRYDLPLSGSTSNNFLRVLIALMTVLGMLALSASFALSAMTDRWSSGLENKVSIEIPASDSDGNVIKPGIVESMTEKVAEFMRSESSVQSAEITPPEKIRELLAPWLGTDMETDSVPLPGLISITFKKDAEPNLKDLEIQLRDFAPRARIDTHENWLADVVRFTSALQFAAALLTMIIGLTTLVAVAGAVRSKLSENKEELELLHLMGASDSYIAKQLQRHTIILALQGGGVGILTGGLLLIVISLIAGEIGVNLVPDFRLDALQKGILLLAPVPIALLAMLTARFTVLRVLAKMP